MRRTILSILIGLCLHWPVYAQDPNPQTSFANTENYANPSLVLNFNDATTSFKEQISGLSFTPPPPNVSYPGVPPPIPSATDIGWWPLNEARQSTAIDNSTSADTGTWHGTQSCSSTYYYSDSSYGVVGCFDGSSDYIAMPYNAALKPASAITVGAWIYPTNTLGSAGWEQIVSLPYRTSGWNPPWGSYYLNMHNGDPQMNVAISGANDACQSSVAVTANQWNFVVGTYDGTNEKIYINGTLENTCAFSGSIDYTGGNAGITIGVDSQYDQVEYFKGRISNPFVLSNALTQPQIAAITPPAAAGPSYDYGGTVTPRQPGFDSTLANNTSAEFPWNGRSAAPNNTLGAAMEWNTPWSMMVQVDRLNWNRTGRLVLASKGDLASGNRWQLYLQMAANSLGDPNVQLSQLCFERYSSAIFLPLLSVGTENGICTGAGDQDVMPNGFNYNIVVTDSGTGASGMYGTTSALDIYINGLDKTTGITEVPFTGSYNAGFGDVGITYSSGTGYANSTVFTSSGGGANCNVAGHLLASGGVPNNLLTDISNYGCTSVPTITLTSPTGTGVTLTPSLIGSSMNSTTSPLMVPGYVSGGTTYGVAGTTSTQTPTYIDEFAIFPFVLNLTQINDLFYWTKFYQIVANTQSANRPVVLLADDGCSDIGNATMTQFVIVLHRLGIIKLEGIVSAGLSSLDVYDSSASFWRQMLDQAGLSNVPVGNLYSGTDSNKNWCQTANLNTYNASTPQASTGFPTSASVVRTVMANNPTTPVIIYNGPAPANNWLYDFLQSPADSISSLTGQQLWDQDVANGGAMWWQGAPSCYPSSYPSPTPCSGSWTTLDASASQYVFSHLDGMPTYQVGGTPQGYGQGFAYTRTAKDPMYLACAAAGGSCSRAGWGQYALASLFTSYFTNGVAVGYSGGGTGYANVTPFTSTGGGANCVVNGIMTASGGVPNGIETSWGAAQPLISTDSMVIGMGSGCTSAPTLVLTNPTGTGVTLTAYPLTVCGTGSVSGSTYSFSSTTCNNQYFVPFTQWANVGMPLIYNWFLNSLSDPPTNGRPMGAQ